MSKNRKADNEEMSSTIFDTIIKDPTKRAMVQKLLTEHKDAIEEYKRNMLGKIQTPLKKLKSRQTCESPTALLRRRELEKLHSDAASDTSSSDQNDSKIIRKSNVPYDRLLKGVIAFVEVKRKGQNLSAPIEIMMSSMGATIRDNFSRDVTHVIFKDGSFTTYQKAKLLKIHLVSVLWLDAVRRTNSRVSEKNYPAFGTEVFDANVSNICSQLQKDYEDVVRDETFRSLSAGFQITRNDTRRKTLLPELLTSSSTYKTADSAISKSSHSTDADLEVCSIIDKQAQVEEVSTSFIQMHSPEVTSDDSDCGVVNGYTSGNLKNKKFLSSTASSSRICDQINEVFSTSKSTTPSTIYSTGKKRRKTLISLSDITLTSNSKQDVNCTTDSESNHSSNNLENIQKISGNAPFPKEATTQFEMSSLRLSVSTRNTLTKPEESKKLPNKGKNKENVPDATMTNSISKKGANKQKNKEKTSDTRMTKSRTRSKTPKRASSIRRDSSSDTQEETPPKTVKKKRRLYGPEDFVYLSARSPSSDEKERRERYKNKTKIPCEDVFINPTDVLQIQNKSSKLPEKMTPTPIQTPKLSGKQKSPKKKQTELRNSNDDEQKQLFIDVVEKKTVRKSLFQKTTDNNFPNTPKYKRRSTLEFQSAPQRSQRKRRIDNRQPTIVCTKLHRREWFDFNNIVKKLGRFRIEDQVTNKTTHLVAGEPKRTVNMLKAMARGCWIVKQDWVLQSGKKGKWLPEEDFEATDFSPFIQKCRLQRQAFGPLYLMDIFEKCGLIFIAQTTNPKCSDLRELVLICKGKLTSIARNAAIVVGQHIRYDKIVCVSELWILDSIQYNRVKSFKDYLLYHRYNTTQRGSPDF